MHLAPSHTGDGRASCAVRGSEIAPAPGSAAMLWVSVQASFPADRPGIFGFR
jgi:hypothetical protein